eukprot:symbB.v1.2.009897.t2/scaffold639.1/size181572/18
MAQAPFSEVSPISPVSLGPSQEDRESVAVNHEITSMSAGFTRLTSHLIEELGTTELLEDEGIRDKLCIEQKDAREKTKGILSLAAFLKRSKTLVLLWSPLYFQRLWCTFELVSFLREREVGRTSVLPVKMVVLIAHLNVTWQLLRIVMKVMNSSDTIATEITSWFTILSLLGLVVLPFYHYLGLKIIADISELPQQLKTFQIQEAKCTCCSRNHVDPETGAEIACDRKLVLYTLKKWQTSQDEDYLQSFNALVRQNLLSIFVNTLEGSFLPLSFYIKMAICANAPWLSDLVSELYAELQVLDFLNVYLVMILLARSSFTLWRCAVLLRHHVPLWLLSFFLIIPMLPLGVALVTLAYFPLYMSPKTSPLPFGCFMLMVLAVIVVFSRPCCRKTNTSRVSLRSVSSQELPPGLLEDLERLVERRERAMERTSWALGLLCVVALTSAGLSAGSLLRSKVD